MSKCGNCKTRLCTCQLVGDEDNEVLGIGSFYEPYQVRPKTPAFRYVESVRLLAVQNITLNTDTPLSFAHSELTITGGNMWDILQPTRITAPIDGLYLVGGYASQATFSSSQIWSIWIRQNGTTPLVKKTVSNQTSTIPLFADVMTLVRLDADDYIELCVRSTVTDTTVLSWNGIITAPRFWAQWMGE